MFIYSDFCFEWANIAEVYVLLFITTFEPDNIVTVNH